MLRTMTKPTARLLSCGAKSLLMQSGSIPATTLSTLSLSHVQLHAPQQAHQPMSAAPMPAALMLPSLTFPSSMMMSQGSLLPSSYVTTLLESRLAQSDASHGWIVDGYPRTAGQARNLVRSPHCPDVLVVLESSDDAARARIAGRRRDTCTRGDDAPHVADKRIATYHAEMPGVLRVMREAGVHVRFVDASAHPQAVFQAVRESLCELDPTSRSNVLVAGLPGVGKGTQGALMAEAFGVPHVSTGSLVRQAVHGQCAASLMADQLEVGEDKVSAHA